MELQPDFKELLELFNRRKVDYLVVGAYALGLHGVPRTTGDLDLWVCPEAENAKRVLAALSEFGFDKVGLTEADFTRSGQVIQLGVPPVRIDLLTSLSGLKWAAAEKACVTGSLGGVPVRFLSRADFVTNKRATGRARDRADMEALGE